MKTWHKASIRWWDDSSGRGVVRLHNSDVCLSLHYSADKKRFDKKLWVSFVENEIVEVQIYEDIDCLMVDRIKKSNWTTITDLLTDRLMNQLDNMGQTEWDHFILYNTLRAIDIWRDS